MYIYIWYIYISYNVSYHIISYHIIAYCIMSCHIASSYLMRSHNVSYHICQIISHYILMHADVPVDTWQCKSLAAMPQAFCCCAMLLCLTYSLSSRYLGHSDTVFGVKPKESIEW